MMAAIKAEHHSQIKDMYRRYALPYIHMDPRVALNLFTALVCITIGCTTTVEEMKSSLGAGDTRSLESLSEAAAEAGTGMVKGMVWHRSSLVATGLIVCVLLLCGETYICRFVENKDRQRRAPGGH